MPRAKQLTGQGHNPIHHQTGCLKDSDSVAASECALPHDSTHQQTHSSPSTRKPTQASRPVSPTRGQTPEARKPCSFDAGQMLPWDQLGPAPANATFGTPPTPYPASDLKQALESLGPAARLHDYSLPNSGLVIDLWLGFTYLCESSSARAYLCPYLSCFLRNRQFKSQYDLIYQLFFHGVCACVFVCVLPKKSVSISWLPNLFSCRFFIILVFIFMIKIYSKYF